MQIETSIRELHFEIVLEHASACLLACASLPRLAGLGGPMPRLGAISCALLREVLVFSDSRARGGSVRVVRGSGLPRRPPIVTMSEVWQG